MPFSRPLSLLVLAIATLTTACVPVPVGSPGGRASTTLSRTLDDTYYSFTVPAQWSLFPQPEDHGAMATAHYGLKPAELRVSREKGAKPYRLMAGEETLTIKVGGVTAQRVRGISKGRSASSFHDTVTIDRPDSRYVISLHHDDLLPPWDAQRYRDDFEQILSSWKWRALPDQAPIAEHLRYRMEVLVDGSDGLEDPQGLAVDASGSVYIADGRGHRVMKYEPALGLRPFTAGDLKHPSDVELHPDGDLLIASADGLSKVSPEGVVTMLYEDPPPPIDLAVSEDGTIGMLTSAAVYRLKPGGKPEFLAGSLEGFTDSFKDGVGAQVSFHYPRDLVVDAHGDLFVADTYSYRVRRLTPEGRSSTFVGDGLRGHLPGVGTQARIAFAYALTIDAEGRFFLAHGFADGPYYLSMISPDGTVQPLGDETGAPIEIPRPLGLEVAPDGRLYMTDASKRVLRFSPGGASVEAGHL